MTTSKTVLFPTDLSEAEHEVLVLATTLAHDMGARLLILHVEPPPVAHGEWYTGVMRRSPQEAAAELKKVVPSDLSVPYEHRSLSAAEIAPTILNVAKDEAVDLIVIGTHGRRGLRHILMGSVAEAVVRGASCPVVSYRRRADESVLDG